MGQSQAEAITKWRPADDLMDLAAARYEQDEASGNHYLYFLPEAERDPESDFPAKRYVVNVRGAVLYVCDVELWGGSALLRLWTRDSRIASYLHSQGNGARLLGRCLWLDHYQRRNLHVAVFDNEYGCWEVKRQNEVVVFRRGSYRQQECLCFQFSRLKLKCPSRMPFRRRRYDIRKIAVAVRKPPRW